MPSREKRIDTRLTPLEARQRQQNIIKEFKRFQPILERDQVKAPSEGTEMASSSGLLSDCVSITPVNSKPYTNVTTVIDKSPREGAGEEPQSKYLSYDVTL